MKVTIDLPEAVWGKLASAADRQNVKVGDLIGRAVVSLIEPKVQQAPAHAPEIAPLPVPTRAPLVDSVTRLNRQGRTDRQIAARLNMTLAAVRAQRYAHNLPINPERKSA